MQAMVYATYVAKILNEIKQAIEASGKTRYRIAQEAGIAQSQLSRVMRGEARLSVDNIERLAEFLDLEIIIRPRRRGSRKRR
jgi:transcriptional regulator with XRE-family HTH domain